jgi:hypothetical protein
MARGGHGLPKVSPRVRHALPFYALQPSSTLLDTPRRAPVAPGPILPNALIQARTARGIHGLPKLSLGPVMRPFMGLPARRANDLRPSSTPLDTPRRSGLRSSTLESELRNALLLASLKRRSFYFHTWHVCKTFCIFCNYKLTVYRTTGEISSIGHSANQPISQSANQPISQSANQPISQSANRPIGQIQIDRTTGQSTDSPIDRPTNRCAGIS